MHIFVYMYLYIVPLMMRQKMQLADMLTAVWNFNCDCMILLD